MSRYASPSPGHMLYEDQRGGQGDGGRWSPSRSPSAPSPMPAARHRGPPPRGAAGSGANSRRMQSRSRSRPQRRHYRGEGAYESEAMDRPSDRYQEPPRRGERHRHHPDSRNQDRDGRRGQRQPDSHRPQRGARDRDHESSRKNAQNPMQQMAMMQSMMGMPMQMAMMQGMGMLPPPYMQAMQRQMMGGRNPNAGDSSDSSDESSSGDSSGDEGNGVMPPAAAMAAMAAMWPPGHPHGPHGPHGPHPGPPHLGPHSGPHRPSGPPPQGDFPGGILPPPPPPPPPPGLGGMPGRGHSRPPSHSMEVAQRPRADAGDGAGNGDDGPALRRSAKVQIENMIRDFRLNVGCAWTMRALPPDKQKLAAKIDPSGQEDPSGYVAEQLKKIV